MSAIDRLAVLNKLSKTTSGAIFAAITTLLFLTSQYLPVFGVLAVFFCPLPLILMHVRFRDIKYTSLVVLVSSTLIGIFSGPVSALAFLMGIGLLGVSLGVTIAARKSAMFSIITSGVVMLVSTLALTLLMSSMMDADISMKKQFALMSESLKKARDENMESLKKSGATTDQINQIDQLYTQTIETMKGMHIYAPLMLFCGALISAFFNYKASCLILKKLKYQSEELPDFETWKISWTVIWFFIAGLLFVNAFDEKASLTQKYLVIAGKNINAAFMAAFIINGLAIVHYYFKFYKVNVTLRVFLYMIIFMNPVFHSLVLMAGIMDPWLDIRKFENNDQITKEV